MCRDKVPRRKRKLVPLRINFGSPCYNLCVENTRSVGQIMPGKCKFNENWTTNVIYKDWVMRDVYSPYRTRCRVCQKSFDVSNMGEAALKSHMKGSKHVELMQKITKCSKTTLPITNFINVEASNEASSSKNINDANTTTATTKLSASAKDTLVSSYLSKEEALKAEIIWMLYTIECHHSFHSNEGVAKIFQAMFPDSETVKKFTCGEKKSAYICSFGLAPYFASILKDKIEKQDSFVLLFDESMNFATKNKQLDVCVRFWDNNRVMTRYWTSKFLGHGTSQDLLRHFNEGAGTLNLGKLFQVSMDGPNVNWKFVDMLSRQLIDEGHGTFLNIGSCGLHIIHGAFKHGSNSTSWELERFFSSIFKLFQDTPARREDFTKVTGCSTFALKFCKHRWLENVPIAERAIQLLPHFLCYAENVQKKKVPDPKTQSFETIKDMVKDPLLEVKINIFISIAKEVTPFLTVYQTDRVMVPFLCDSLFLMLKSLMSRVIKSEVLKEHGTTPVALHKLDIEDKENQLNAHKVGLGFVGTEQMKKLVITRKVSEKQALELRVQCKQFILTLIKHLKLKSPLSYQLVRALRCLNPHEMLGNRDVCIERFQRVLKALVDANKLIQGKCDDIKRQYTSFLDEEVPKYLSCLKAFDHKNEDSHIEQLFHEMMTSKKCYEGVWSVVKNLLILSHGQATVERGFSTNKQMSRENLQEHSFIALRQVHDHIKSVSGAINVEITKKMITSVATARQRYMAYLNEEKRKKEKQAMSLKRKSLLDEIEDLKTKKKRLESDAAALNKSADEFLQNAEVTQHGLSSLRHLVAKSNSHRRTSKEKLEEAADIDKEINSKLQCLKEN